eukprot:UN31803
MLIIGGICTIIGPLLYILVELKIAHFSNRTYVGTVCLGILAGLISQLILDLEDPWVVFAIVAPLFPGLGIMIALYQIWIVQSVDAVVEGRILGHTTFYQMCMSSVFPIILGIALDYNIYFSFIFPWVSIL